MSVKKFLSLLVFVLSFGLSSPVWAQPASVSGKIIDGTNGTGLPGASVIIDGTTQGTTTDMDGNFKINSVTPGSIKIKVSYIGYVTQLSEVITITAGEQKALYVTLKENINQLQEAKIVGQRTTHTDNAVLME